MSSRVIPEGGAKLYAGMSDWILRKAAAKPDSTPRLGDTPMLAASLAYAWGLDTPEKFAADSRLSLNFVPGAEVSMHHLQRETRGIGVGIVSGAYQPHIHGAARILGIPVENTRSTPFPLESFYAVRQRDIEEIKASTPKLVKAAEQADDKVFDAFYEWLLGSSFAKPMQRVRPCGGERKVPAAIDLATRFGARLDQIVWTGDSAGDKPLGEVVLRGGGLFQTTNGNRGVVTVDSVAVVSPDIYPAVATSLVFHGAGLDHVRTMVENWGKLALTEEKDRGYLPDWLFRRLTEPGVRHGKVYNVTEQNKAEVIEAGERERVLLRGTPANVG